MVVLLLAASLMAASDPVADMVEHARSKLTVSDCGEDAVCTPASDFRVSSDADDQLDPDSKDRAFADNGSYCGVVGDKQCLSRPRFQLHASLPGGANLGPIQMSPILPRR